MLYQIAPIQPDLKQQYVFIDILHFSQVYWQTQTFIDGLECVQEGEGALPSEFI